ncbi:MAG: amino acid ABC transporter substrate-binding protein [Anaerolineae bacterium]|nr:amino acid ABC transporter substrate-binding protein [Anaerolineae bacterium]
MSKTSNLKNQPNTDSPRLTFHIPRVTRFIIVILLLVIGGVAFFLFPRDDGTLAEIRQRGTLRVGLDASFPPFETINEQGQIVGLDVDIAQAVAADLGVELELVNIGFDGLYDALLARRADLVISGLPYDPRWTQDVAYTRNYFNAGQVLVTPADESTIDGPEDVVGRTVAVEWGSQADMEGRRLEKEAEGVTLQRYPSAAEALEAVLNNQVDAAIVDGVSAVAATSRGLRPVTYLTDEWYAAAVHIDSRELLDVVNQTLTRLDESGEMAKMQVKWLENGE